MWELDSATADHRLGGNDGSCRNDVGYEHDTGLKVLVSGGYIKSQAAVHALALLYLAYSGAALRGRFSGGQGKAQLVIITAGQRPEASLFGGG